MEYAIESVPIERSNIGLETLFSISEEGMPFILNILRNQIYSDKFAFIREYSVNALDAHVEAGIPERPIEINLPSKLGMTFSVRDFGKGLDEDQIRKIFVSYGSSTKRKDQRQTGMFGIGCKSGFAYGDNFIVITYQNGLKNIYNAYIDETQNGKIALLMSEPTTEENGLQIDIPIREDDLVTLISKAKEIFRYFRVRPIINGDDGFYLGIPIEPKFFGTNWKVFNNQSQPIAVMGNVAYPINYRLMWSDFNQDYYKYNETLSLNPILEFKMGELEFAASRETLEYKPKTITAINGALEVLKAELSKSLQDEVTKQTDVFSAFRFYHELKARFKNHNILDKYDLVWNGLNIKGNLSLDKNEIELIHAVYRYKRGNYKFSIGAPEYNPQIPMGEGLGKNSIIVINDLEGSTERKIILRLNHTKKTELLELRAVHLIRFLDPTKEAEILKKYYLDTIKICRLSEMTPEPDLIRNSYSGTRTYNPKYSKQVLKLNNVNSVDYKESWNILDDFDIESGGVYVLVNRFGIFEDTYRDRVDPSELAAKMAFLDKLLKELNIKGDIKPIHGFKMNFYKANKDEIIKNGWIDVTEYFKLLSENIFKKNQELFDVHNYLNLTKNSHEPILNALIKFISYYELAQLKDDHIIRRFKKNTLRITYLQTYFNWLKNNLQFSFGTNPFNLLPLVDLKPETLIINQKYPLLKGVDEDSYLLGEDIVKYIEMVDKLTLDNPVNPMYADNSEVSI